jgi:hypothetical protein
MWVLFELKFSRFEPKVQNFETEKRREVECRIELKLRGKSLLRIDEIKLQQNARNSV